MISKLKWLVFAFCLFNQLCIEVLCSESSDDEDIINNNTYKTVYEDAKKNKNSDSQVKLGEIYKSLGYHEEAKKWYSRAVFQLNSEGMFKYASCIEDEKQAFILYMSAAEKGHVGALMELANIFANSDGSVGDKFNELSDNFNLDRFKELEKYIKEKELVFKK